LQPLKKVRISFSFVFFICNSEEQRFSRISLYIEIISICVSLKCYFFILLRQLFGDHLFIYESMNLLFLLYYSYYISLLYYQFWLQRKNVIRKNDYHKPFVMTVVNLEVCPQRMYVISAEISLCADCDFSHSVFARVTGGTGTRHTSPTHSRESYSARKTSSAWRNTREWQSQMQSRLHGVETMDHRLAECVAWRNSTGCIITKVYFFAFCIVLKTCIAKLLRN